MITILGGGISGLSCAYELDKHNIPFRSLAQRELMVIYSNLGQTLLLMMKYYHQFVMN